ncbi:MAG: GDCCVxC domain-containing (seleno)protein [Gemmatimonas sp.]
MNSIALDSRLTCPFCGFAETLSMSTNACTFYHVCASCQLVLRPKPGHCCVFCSFGTVPCPPVQADATRANCCTTGHARE